MKLGFLIVLILLGPVGMAQARTVDVPEEGFSIDIPDMLTVTLRQGTAFFATDATNTSSISVTVFPNSTNQKIQAAYIEGIQESLKEQGKKAGAELTQMMKEAPLIIGGAPAYEISAVTIFPKGVTVYIHQYPVFANHKTYVVAVQTYDLRQESQIMDAAQSFRFSAPPELPDMPDNPHSQIAVMMGEDISIVIPSNWFTDRKVERHFEARDVSGRSKLAILRYLPNEGLADPKTYIENMKKDSTAAEIVHAKVEYGQDGPTNINGVPAYFLQSTTTAATGEKSYACIYAFIANDKPYGLSTWTLDPDQIPVLDGIARTIRIGAGMTLAQVQALAPTLVSSSSSSINSVPVPNAESARDPNYAIGFRMGQITFYVLLIAALMRGIYLVCKRMK